MNASRPIHVAFNIFYVPDSNSSKTQAEMQEMRSEVGSAMKSVLLGTFSDDDNAQDCNIVYSIICPEILVGNLFWRIGGFESNSPIFYLPKFSV